MRSGYPLPSTFHEPQVCLVSLKSCRLTAVADLRWSLTGRAVTFPGSRRDARIRRLRSLRSRSSWSLQRPLMISPAPVLNSIHLMSVWPPRRRDESTLFQRRLVFSRRPPTVTLELTRQYLRAMPTHTAVLHLWKTVVWTTAKLLDRSLDVHLSSVSAKLRFDRNWDENKRADASRPCAETRACWSSRRYGRLTTRDWITLH